MLHSFQEFSMNIIPLCFVLLIVKTIQNDVGKPILKNRLTSPGFLLYYPDLVITTDTLPLSMSILPACPNDMECRAHLCLIEENDKMLVFDCGFKNNHNLFKSYLYYHIIHEDYLKIYKISSNSLMNNSKCEIGFHYFMENSSQVNGEKYIMTLYNNCEEKNKNKENMDFVACLNLKSQSKMNFITNKLLERNSTFADYTNIPLRYKLFYAYRYTSNLSFYHFNFLQVSLFSALGVTLATAAAHIGHLFYYASNDYPKTSRIPPDAILSPADSPLNSADTPLNPANVQNEGQDPLIKSINPL